MPAIRPPRSSDPPSGVSISDGAPFLSAFSVYSARYFHGCFAGIEVLLRSRHRYLLDGMEIGSRGTAGYVFATDGANSVDSTV